MRSLKFLITLWCAPFLLAAFATAAEVEKKAEATKPSLSFYYFDG